MNSQNKLSSVSFFCPAYREEKNLPDLIPVVSDFLEKNALKYEILIIEDGSPDNTFQVAKDLAKRFPHVRVIHHEKNAGYSATLKEGFEISQYDYVMYTDGDNQYNVFDFEPGLHLLESNDVIAGYAIKKAVSPFRKFQSWTHNFLISLLFFTAFRDINCSMKIFKRKVIENLEIKSNPRGAFIDAEMMIKAKRTGFKIKQFPVTHYERKVGIAIGSKPSVIFHTITDMIKLRLGLL
ncbi:MAG: glycosyltransferase family 2 protein [bacterium]|nr:glycosyltransferase family 2 protein [bacterium]